MIVTQKSTRSAQRKQQSTAAKSADVPEDFLRALQSMKAAENLNPYTLKNFPSGFSIYDDEFYINGEKIAVEAMARMTKELGAYMRPFLKGLNIQIIEGNARLLNANREDLADEEIGVSFLAISAQDPKMILSMSEESTGMGTPIAKLDSDGQIDAKEIGTMASGVSLFLQVKLYQLLFVAPKRQAPKKLLPEQINP